MPPDAKVAELELETYKLLLQMFNDLAPRLATSDEPLPALDVQWSGPKRTIAQYEAMKELEPDMDEEEIRLRYRAFG